MNILINTKYNIGDIVYTCIDTLKFKEGKFYKIYEPESTPSTIARITAYISGENSISYAYLLNNHMHEYISEDNIFSSYEECKKYCENYE